MLSYPITLNNETRTDVSIRIVLKVKFTSPPPGAELNMPPPRHLQVLHVRGVALSHTRLA